MQCARRSRRTAVRGTVAAAAALAVAACALPADDPDPPLLACERPSVGELQSTVAEATGWLGRALQEDGRFWYEYNRAADEFSDDYHEVRHAGTAMSLFQVAAHGADAGTAALTVGDSALPYLALGTVETGDRLAVVADSRRAHLGATALTVAALVHRRIATGEDELDPALASLGRFMLSLMRDDGGMWGWATRDELVPIEGLTSTFYTGEAFWAFGLLANQFPGDGWDDAAERVGGYIATERDREEAIDDPPLADQWAAYGFAEMRDWGPLDPDELRYVRRLVDRYHGRVTRELDREQARVGDGSGPPDETVAQARGAAFGTTVEALGALWRLAAVDPGLADLEEQLRGDLVCGAAVLAARQYDAARAAEWPRPDVVEGAWFDEDVTRVDDQQHAMSGVLLALGAVTP